VNTTDVAVELTAVAAVPPTVTLVAPVRFVPVSVTTLPAVNGPIVTFKLVAAGTPTKVKADDFVTVPVGPAKVTATRPALLAGVVTTADVAVFDTTVPALDPNVTEFTYARFVPVIVTCVPPAIAPAIADRDVTVGAAAKVKALVFVTEPPGVVTITDTAVALATFAGVDTTSEESDLDAIVPAVPPNVTEVACAKFVPVNVTD
jgi:hypothetical protein